MQEEHARAVADLAVIGVGAVAAIWILKTPALRRATWRLLKYVLFTAAPSYLWRETTRAWAESAQQPGRA